MSTSTSLDQIPVLVFHNLMFLLPGKYEPGDPAVQVFATTAPAGSDHLAVCEQMFHLLNVGDDPEFGPPDIRAVAYRARGNRSLCVSDLVCVDGTWYACASAGFTLTEPPRIRTDATAGSSPYTGVDAPAAAENSVS